MKGSCNVFRRYLPRIGIPLVVAITFGIAGCSDYSITVNDNLLHTPPTIFTDFKLPDYALQKCIDDTISDEHLTKAEQLTRLFCTNRTIGSLEKVDIFVNLKQIGLADNKLKDISPLAHLNQLEQINLKGNEIEDATPLKNVTTLRFADLSDNPNLDCKSAPVNKRLKVIMPAHC